MSSDEQSHSQLLSNSLDDDEAFDNDLLESSSVNSQRPSPEDLSLSNYDCTKYNHLQRRNLKRRLLTYHRIQRIPKLLRGDIRRSLSTMFVNMVNYNDSNLFQHFMNNYVMGDCNIHFALFHNNFLYHTYAVNRSAITTMFAYMFNKYPDGITKILDSNIYRRSNTPDIEIKSRLLCQATDPNALNTIRYLTPPPPEHIQLRKLTYNEHMTYSEYCDFYETLDQVTTELEFSLKINEHGRIYAMEFIPMNINRQLFLNTPNEYNSTMIHEISSTITSSISSSNSANNSPNIVNSPNYSLESSSSYDHLNNNNTINLNIDEHLCDFNHTSCDNILNPYQINNHPINILQQHDRDFLELDFDLL